MAQFSNRRYVLAQRPSGEVTRNDFRVETIELSDVPEGSVIVETHSISIDPAMRGWMNDVRSYIPPVAIDDVMRAFGVGVVVASSSPRLPVGTAISGTLGVQRYATLRADDLEIIDLQRAPIEAYLNTLGVTGLSAYFGLLDVGKPLAGQTVVVSAAAGGVGSLVGQIAKIKGCRVVGIAGGADKCAYVRDVLGFDGVIDYRSEKVSAGLRRECPHGIDVFFDNVGGAMLDDVLAKINKSARVVICGAVSQYNSVGAPYGPTNYLSLLVNRASMAGFIVFDYADRYSEALDDLAQWYESGALKSSEEIMDGLDSFPEALQRLFGGDKIGKLLVRVSSIDG